MDQLKHQLIEKFHVAYCKNKSNVENISALANYMKNNFSGKNIKQKIIDKHPLWINIFEEKGFGKSKKIKVEGYRLSILMAWEEICSLLDSDIKENIYHAYAKYAFRLNENEYEPNALSIVESLILLNKLWKNSNMVDIFVDYFGFLFNHSRTLDELASKSSLTRERIRQLKNKCISEFENKFIFFKDFYFRAIFDEYFEDKNYTRSNIFKFTNYANENYNVSFSPQFYTKIIAIIYELNIVGNLNDAKSQNKSSSKGNVWNDIYIQTKEQKENFALEEFVDLIGKINHKNKGYYKDDLQVSIREFLTSELSNDEIAEYNKILENEFNTKIELYSDKAIIRRNSYVSKHEYVEKVLKDLGGLEYIDVLVEKLNKLHPDIDNWTDETVRSTVLRRSEFYTVGKSGLYGLKSVNDVQDIAGDGTLNDIMRLHLESKNKPIHIYGLLKNVNEIFPRSKSIHSIHSILEQDSRDIFVKLQGGFYGLNYITYKDTNFPKIRGFHGKLIRSIIQKDESKTLQQVLHEMNHKLEILPIQLEYLLTQAVDSGDLVFLEGKYSSAIDVGLDNEYDTFPLDEISEQIYDKITDADFDDDIIQLEEYNVDPFVQIKIRRGQPRFRKALMILYNSTCIVSKCEITPILEAAHVMPHSKSVNYNLSNGLILRSDLHTLFDASLLAINPKTMKVHLNPILLKDSLYSKYQQIDIGKRLKDLHYNYSLNREGLDWRWEVFQDNI